MKIVKSILYSVKTKKNENRDLEDLDCCHFQFNSSADMLFSDRREKGGPRELTSDA